MKPPSPWKKLKMLYLIAIGKEVDDLIKDVSANTSAVCKKVDELLTRAQLDGEDNWFSTKERKNNVIKFNKSCEGNAK